MEIREGDIFKWRYVNVPCDSYEIAYWCKDGMAIATSPEVLVDTYWHGPYKCARGDDSYHISLPNPNIELEFICNLKDVEVIEKWNVLDYNEQDRYNLSYQKGYRTLWVKRKGANKSKEAILQKLQGELTKAYSDKLSIEYKIQSINLEIEEISNEKI